MSSFLYKKTDAYASVFLCDNKGMRKTNELALYQNGRSSSLPSRSMKSPRPSKSPPKSSAVF